MNTAGRLEPNPSQNPDSCRFTSSGIKKAVNQMPDEKFEDARKAKQSIRRKSSRRSSKRKSTTRRQSKRQSQVKSGRPSRIGAGNKSVAEKGQSIQWDEEELGISELMENLQNEPVGGSPIDLELWIMKKVTILPQLQWLNTENNPFAVKIANTGYTATITGLWPPKECPKIRGGPLKEDYDFSQVHFHWGENENDGSEHLVNHFHYPMEVHAVFHKSSYGIHERARREVDGLIVVVYMYTLSKTPNATLEPLISNVTDVPTPLTEKYIDPFKYSHVFPTFSDDYILYNGWMKHRCEHAAMWFICRETLGINKDQLERFRQMVGAQGQPILKNYREVKEVKDLKVFIVYPSSLDTDCVLHPRPMTPPTPPPESTNRKSRKSEKKRSDRRQSQRKSSVKRKSKVAKDQQPKPAAKRQSKAAGKRQSMKRKSKTK